MQKQRLVVYFMNRYHSELTVSTDVDQKVDAVTKLQAEFESGTEVRASYVYKRGPRSPTFPLPM